MSVGEAHDLVATPSWKPVGPYGIVPGDMVRIVAPTRRAVGFDDGNPIYGLRPSGEGRHARNLVWPLSTMTVVARVTAFQDDRHRPRSGKGRRCHTWTVVMDPVEVWADDEMAWTPPLWNRWTVTTEFLRTRCEVRRDPEEGPRVRSLRAGVTHLRDMLIEAAGQDPLQAVGRLVHPNGAVTPLGVARATDLLEGRANPREWMIRQLSRDGAGLVAEEARSRSVVPIVLGRRPASTAFSGEGQVIEFPIRRPVKQASDA